MGEKVVMDTNVYVSALCWDGVPRQVVRDVFFSCELILSLEQLRELERVLSYPKLSIKPEEREAFLRQILSVAELIDTPGSLSVIVEDPDDNAILESAVVGRASYLISGDNHLLSLGEFRDVLILTPRAFIDL